MSLRRQTGTRRSSTAGSMGCIWPGKFSPKMESWNENTQIHLSDRPTRFSSFWYSICQQTSTKDMAYLQRYTQSKPEGEKMSKNCKTDCNCISAGMKVKGLANV